MKTRPISIFILSIMLMCFIQPAFAASDEAIDAAHQLYEQGLFLGTGVDSNGNPNFDLDRTPNRFEAVTMLVRLLGKEEEARETSWETPFTDVVEWAKPYVGYAYSNGLTSGTSSTTYGGNEQTTVSQYLTFVLRTLGYDNTDFTWDKAWELSDKIKLTNGEYNSTTTNFTRGDLVTISYRSLTIPRKVYNRNFSELSESAVIIGISNIKSNITQKEYEYAEITYKGSKYTNMANSYFHDEFFFNEFPEYKNELILEINAGAISGVSYNGKVYLDAVNMIQFFRQYEIEFYETSKNYQYIPQELPNDLPPEPTTDKVEYNHNFNELSTNAVITDYYDIEKVAGNKKYIQAMITVKASKYTNMATNYFHDEFFFNEFPEYEYEIKSAVNSGQISGILYDGEVYLDAVNMIQFFRQYEIEFYHGSQNYRYIPSMP